jgi:deazaflavin-dependent oxidoreductase (nitroreductase family)
MAGAMSCSPPRPGRRPIPTEYHNLKAQPNARIEVGSDTIEVVASEVTGEERERLYRTQAERIPQFAEYEQKTDRVIPVVVLTPATTS